MDRRRPKQPAAENEAAPEAVPPMAAPEPTTAPAPEAVAPAAVAPAAVAPTAVAPMADDDSPDDSNEWDDQLAALDVPHEPHPAQTRSQPQPQDNDPLAAFTDPEPSAPSAQGQPSAAGRVAAPAAAYPNLTIRSGAHNGKIVPLLPITMSIGREHDNNVELKDPEVSRYHARIDYEDGRYYVEDLNSSTGTWVNGNRERRRALDEGDVIRIGGTELVFEFD
jgi:hypothetical protein